MTKQIEHDNVVAKDFLWTIERYERAIEAGIFTEDDKIELIYGKIIELAPAEIEHEYCVTISAEFFRDRFGKQFSYREEKSLLFENDLSIPEPDLVVLKDINYSRRRPSPEDVYLVAEVARSSLKRDRTVKVELYAGAGLAEYWIVNLANRQIEVHLKPDSEQRIYASVNAYREGEKFVSPFAGEVTVADLLPEQTDEEE